MTTKPSAPEPPRQAESSQPEIRVRYAPAGRETLDAITHELLPLPVPVIVTRENSSPEIVVHETAIERDTLAAIMEEARAEDPESTPLVNPAVAAVPAPSAPTSVVTAAESALEIFEILTYVVRGGDVARLASEPLRRRFVEQNLLARLPVRSMTGVDRIDVTPWTVQGTFVVRVWCKTKT